MAGGAGARRLMAAGQCGPLIAERGYHIRGSAARWPATMPPVMFEEPTDHRRRYAGSAQVAAFVELSCPDAAPDSRKWKRPERHVADPVLPIDGRLPVG